MDKLIGSLKTLYIPESDYFGISTDVQRAYDKANEMLDDCIDIVEKSEQPIYEVLVYSHPWHLDEHHFLDFGSEERVGFYYEKSTAIQAIEENWCDLQDHYAQAAAIREVKPGLYQYPPFSTYLYYLWNTESRQWERAEVPVEVGEFC